MGILSLLIELSLRKPKQFFENGLEVLQNIKVPKWESSSLELSLPNG